MTEFDFQKLLNRAIRYFECWGGDVQLNQEQLPTTEDLIKNLEEAGIPYESHGNGVISYSVDIDKERNRKGGFSTGEDIIG